VVGRFIEKRGEGLHHVAYRVEDIDRTLASLKERDVDLIDTEPRVGIWGSRVAFLHPRATGGVLTELVEPVEGDWRRGGGDE
jgi:methylmalonyl-CoA/ethylmalonyl-CoA epimerase